MIPSAALVAASALAFDCVVDLPRNVIPDGDKVTSQAIGLPSEMSKWAFAIDINPGEDEGRVRINWPGDPIRAGTGAFLTKIGPQDYSFVSFHSGPCLFTVRTCLFLYTLSVQPDGSAVILVQPSAIATNEERFSKPFQVFMTGRCAPKGSSQ